MSDIFRCTVPINKHPNPISHSDPIMMLGSCFSENISRKLSMYHFNINCNPTGILYNPLSISSAMKRIISGELYENKDLIFHNGLWHSLDHHSRFSSECAETVLEDINTSLIKAHTILHKVSHLILTPGTSFTFQHTNSGKIVANCHQLPKQLFVRHCVTSTTISQNWFELIQLIKGKFPDIHIIITISPVRHYPSAPTDNQVSKANIISAFDFLRKKFSGIYYFPSYEIMMDELRDYRFYESDMIHPNCTAIDYIWKRFCETCIAKRSAQFIVDYAPVQSALEHRHSDRSSSENIKKFKNATLKKLASLSSNYPEIDLTHIRTRFNNL